MTIKRYNKTSRTYRASSGDNLIDIASMTEDEHGQYIKYNDIKHLIEMENILLKSEKNYQEFLDILQKGKR